MLKSTKQCLLTSQMLMRSGNYSKCITCHLWMFTTPTTKEKQPQGSLYVDYYYYYNKAPTLIHNIIQIHNNDLWDWIFLAKHCQSHITLLWIWTLLCTCHHVDYLNKCALLFEIMQCNNGLLKSSSFTNVSSLGRSKLITHKRLLLVQLYTLVKWL